MNDYKKIIEILSQQFPGIALELKESSPSDPILLIPVDHNVKILKELKENMSFGFHVLQVISAVDFVDRVELSYMLANFFSNKELIVKTILSKKTADLEGLEEFVVDSVTSLWASANWQEREAFDMMGIRFTGHPDLRRILCPDDWQGYPLRKNYKVQEVYNGMIVNPVSKTNKEERNFKTTAKDVTEKVKSDEV